MLRTAVALALLFVLLGVTGVREASAGNFLLVDTTSDAPIASGCFDEFPDGDCSLRGAIGISNGIPGLKALIFNVGSGVPEFDPGTPLPDITQPVLMDGASGGATAINISGISVQGGTDGLRLVNHSGSTIKHMVINGFEAGIAITGGGGHTIVGNKIGTTKDGASRFSNNNGVVLQNTINNTIGGDGDDRNVISGNVKAGVLLDSGADNNIIAGNSIGLSQDWSIVIDNHEGVSVTGLSSHNQIGTAGIRNVIGGNVRNGVLINGTGTQVWNNLIGVTPLAQAKPNGQNGIFLGANATGTVIGGSLDNRNVISGNAMAGVHIESGAGVEVSGNIIGLNAFGDSAVANQGNGIEVVQTTAFAPNALPSGGGGTTNLSIGKPGAPNTISGNVGDAILIGVGVSGVSVKGNKIGVNVDQTAGFLNGLYGIHVEGHDNTIGGPSDGEGNFVTGSSDTGVLIDGRPSGGAAGGNHILSNWIGGKPDIGGNGNGIWVVADFTDITNNTIVDNEFKGIIIDGDDNVVSENLIGTNRDGDEVGNGGDGVTIAGDGNLISQVAASPAGGAQFPQGSNIIWNNGGSGVFVAEGVGNTISQNSMKNNFGGAIDLAPEGPTPNDTDDHDQGANTLQNHPVLSAAGQSQTFTQGNHPSGGGGSLQGSLNSTPNTDFVIDVYTQAICNETTNLQPAEEWIGSFQVTTKGNGDVQFSQAAFTDMQPGAYINATATNATGSTSELSACIQVTGTTPTPTPSPSPTNHPTVTPSPTPSGVKDDADCDGDVDMDDFIAVLTEVAGVAPGAPCANLVGCEDPLDARDALDILLYVASPNDFPLPLC